jgi:hypothetical protein
MDGTSGIWTVLSSGDTLIQTCSTSSSASSHLTKCYVWTLEASDVLPVAIFAGEVIPSEGPLAIINVSVSSVLHNAPDACSAIV